MIGITAPREIAIHRDCVWQAIQGQIERGEIQRPKRQWVEPGEFRGIPMVNVDWVIEMLTPSDARRLAVELLEVANMVEGIKV